jgi:hypothetical protein
MPDYRRMFDDKEHLYAYDLDGREVAVQIEKVFAGELIGEKGRKSKKPMIKFVGKDKKLAVNKTNGKTIAKLYGKNTDDWEGQWITIYPTTTEFGGETMDCIRVKPVAPQPRGNGNGRGGNRAAKGQDLTQQIADKMNEQSAGGYVSDVAAKADAAETSEGGDAPQ